MLPVTNCKSTVQLVHQSNWMCSSWPKSSLTKLPLVVLSPNQMLKGCAPDFLIGTHQSLPIWVSMPQLHLLVFVFNTNVLVIVEALSSRRLTPRPPPSVLSVWSAKDSFAPPNLFVIVMDAIVRIVLVIGALIRPIGEHISIWLMIIRTLNKTSWPRLLIVLRLNIVAMLTTMSIIRKGNR